MGLHTARCLATAFLEGCWGIAGPLINVSLVSFNNSSLYNIGHGLISV